MALRPDEQVNLKGKFHPLYRGILREAHENGLLELSVKLIEAPTAENGQTAICEATAVFPGDGRERIFTEIGDCNERNCTPMIAAHRIRMAATRAKGRALRDALGIGEALVEEMGGTEEAAAGAGSSGDRVREQRGASRANERVRPAESRGDRAANPPAPASADAPAVAPIGCEQCGVVIEDPRIAALSRQKFEAVLCVPCGKELLAIERAKVPTGQIAA